MGLQIFAPLRRTGRPDRQGSAITVTLTQPGVDGWLAEIEKELERDRVPLVLHFNHNHYQAVHFKGTKTTEAKPTLIQNNLHI